MPGVLDRLQSWYAQQCDDVWEHSHGIKIDTSDNPGWIVEIDLTGTECLGHTFQEVSQGLGEANHPEEA